jgi:hypothetical protein
MVRVVRWTYVPLSPLSLCHNDILLQDVDSWLLKLRIPHKVNRSSPNTKSLPIEVYSSRSEVVTAVLMKIQFFSDVEQQTLRKVPKNINTWMRQPATWRLNISSATFRWHRDVFSNSFARGRLVEGKGKSPHHEESVSNSECLVAVFSVTDLPVVPSRDCILG